MDIFFTLFTNLIPLYALIAIGFIAGRYFNVERESVANLVIFVCLPIVVFGFVVNLEFQLTYVFLPILVFCAAAIVGGSMYWLGQKVFKDNRANLLSMCASMPNSGYFGLPLVLLLFEPQWVGVYMFMMLGITIYDSTIGYYIAARGSFTVRDSLIKLVKFPSLYAITLALILNLMQVDMPEMFHTYWGHFKGAYVVMGMMIIGVALASVNKLVFGPRFQGLAFMGKFVMWPVLIAGLILLDQALLNLFHAQIYKLMIVLSIVPPAANIAAFAAQLGVQPEKAATTVLAGTIIALFYIPLVVVLTGL